MDIKEAADQIADMLQNFAKTKNSSLAEVSAVSFKVQETILLIVPTLQTAIADYAQVSSEFLDKVIQVRGIPVRTMVLLEKADSDNTEFGVVSASGPKVAQQFDKLLPN